MFNIVIWNDFEQLSIPFYTNLFKEFYLYWYFVVGFLIIYIYILFFFKNHLLHILFYFYSYTFVFFFLIQNLKKKIYLNLTKFSLYKTNFFFFNYNTITLVFFFICLFMTLICINLSTRKNNKYFIILTSVYLMFNFLILFFVISKTLILFFFTYEIMLLLSFILVFISGQNKRSLLTSIYFLIWTQFGSFLIFLGIMILVINKNITYFYNLNKINNNLMYLLTCFFFFGFSIKIPTWPFNFWLTKTHVEANTGFSIFLSGILVKTAVIGLYKIFYFFTYFNIIFFLWFFIVSIYDVALKIIMQIDYKKIIAYATIFEMNLLTFFLFNFSKKNLIFLIFFFFFHSVISGVFFFIVDLLFKIYNTRIINGIASLNKNNLTLSYLFFFFFSYNNRISTNFKICFRICFIK